jgi:hypothetical protein
MPFAGLWRVPERPLEPRYLKTAGRRSNESTESTGALRGYWHPREPLGGRITAFTNLPKPGP